MKLKICGMAEAENISEVAALSPDYMGFIFWDKSPRRFRGIMPPIPEIIIKVGVFVDEDLQNILAKTSEFKISTVQLHGNETPEFCGELKQNGLSIIKAFSIGGEFNFDILNPYDSVCDFYLFDTKGKSPGGNGISFDWRLLNDYPFDKPFFLSGGIGINDIEAINKLQLNVYAIDVNSKFETQPGIKNAALLQTFQSTLS